jgi:uncharacterized protein (DUF4415 family)
MAREGRIVRYTAEELAEMRRRGEGRTDWERLRAMSEEELEALIRADPDDVDYPEDWPEGIIPGLPEPKEKISLRLDADVLRWFRAQGPRYQTRINAVLRAYMQSRRAADTPPRKRRKA